MHANRLFRHLIFIYRTQFVCSPFFSENVSALNFYETRKKKKKP